jgi:hypothetical protein
VHPSAADLASEKSRHLKGSYLALNGSGVETRQ